MKQIFRRKFIPDAGVISKPHEAVSRRPEKQVSGNWVSGIENAVFNLG
jgi:hypothetical protein